MEYLIEIPDVSFTDNDPELIKAYMICYAMMEDVPIPKTEWRCLAYA